MAKGNKKETSKQDVEKGFADWKKMLQELKENADKCYMPLLAKSFELSEDILKTYEKAFMYSIK